MNTDQESLDFKAAAAIAMEEAGLAGPTDTEPSLPEADVESQSEIGQVGLEDTEGQATSQNTETVTEPVEGEGEDSGLFTDLEVGAAEEAPAIPEDAVFDLPGVEEPVSLQELKDGYQRQADYTRKTQQVAEDRKANEKAVGLWEALQAQPEAVVRQLAAQVGLIDEGAAPVKAFEASPIRSAEQVEAEIASRVEAAVAAHPSIVEAERQEALRTLDAEFDRISEVRGITLNEADRKRVLQEAQRRNNPDLESVVSLLLSLREKQVSEREALAAAAPARPTGSPSTEAVTAPATSFDEAKKRALIEHGLQ